MFDSKYVKINNFGGNIIILYCAVYNLFFKTSLGQRFDNILNRYRYKSSRYITTCNQ